MALPATDSFTNTDGTELSAHSASWTAVLGTININTNAYHPASSGALSYRWNADAFNGNHYSESTFTSTSGAAYCGVSVRNQSGAATYYALNGHSTGTDTYLVEVTAGSQAVIATSSTAAWAVTDVIRLEIDGSTLTPLQNGGQVTGLAATYTDSSITGGSAGVSGFNSNTANRADDWTGDDIGGAPSATILNIVGDGGLAGGSSLIAGNGGGLVG